MDEALRAAAQIAAAAANVDDALEAASRIAVIPEPDANSSAAADAQAEEAGLLSASAIVSSEFRSGGVDVIGEGHGGAGREHPRVLLGGRAYSARDGPREAPAMNLTLEEGRSFSVAFTASWYSLQASSRALAIFDDGAKGVRLRISNAGSTSTLALAVRREGREATLKVPEAIAVGVTSRFLCTVGGDDAGGRMRVYRDGKRIGLLRHGLSLGGLPRGRLYLAGGPAKSGEVGRKNHSSFEGWLSDICTWDRQASWEDASACAEKPGHE